MTSLRRKFSVDFAWNAASLAVVGLAGIVLNAAVVHRAGAEALGVFNQVFALYIFLSQLSVGGIHFSALKQISYHQEDSKRCSAVAASALILSAILATVVAGAAYVGRGVAGAVLGSADVATGLGLAAPGLVGFAVNKVALNVLNGLGRMRAYAVFQALRMLLILTAIVAILALALEAPWLAASLSAAELTLALALLAYVDRRVLSLRPSPAARDWIREHLSFGSRGALSGALGEINTRVDVVTLGYFASDRLVGVYSFPALLAEGLSQLAIVARRNVDPLLGEAFSRGDTRRVETASRRLRRVFVPVMLAACAVALAVYPWAVRRLSDDPAFAASTGVFAILLVGVVINSAYRPFLGILLQAGRPGTHTVFAALLVAANLAGNLLLIPVLGIHGAAIATAGVLVLEALLIALFARRLLGIIL